MQQTAINLVTNQVQDQVQQPAFPGPQPLQQISILSPAISSSATILTTAGTKRKEEPPSLLGTYINILK